MTSRKRITIIGGGLAGLTAAATAAQGGADVLVHEARNELGGRARTTTIDGFDFNQGPHALYAASNGISVLGDLGISVTGKRPPASGGYGRLRGTVGLLPGTPLEAIKSRLVGLRTKAQLGGLVASPKRALKTETDGRSMQQWIDEQLSDHDARLIMAMISRVATYTDDLTTIDAHIALSQVVGAMTDGVLYLDHGWQQIVAQLERVANHAGAKIEYGSKIESIDQVRESDAIIVANGGPNHVAKFLGTESSICATWAAEAQPVFASCLDVALRALPQPKRRVCFGVDEPLYLSVHTPSAQLAPSAGGELMHVMQYGDSDVDPRARLEGLIDDVQPGWRDETVAQQYGRRMLVAHDRPKPGSGVNGRPAVAVPDCDNVFVAGDWVGSRGLLADASLASGREAGLAAIGTPWR